MKYLFKTLIVFVLCLGVILSGCAKTETNEPKETVQTGENTPVQSTDNEVENEPVDLTMVIWGSPAHVEMYDNLLASYKDENPNTNIEVITATYGEFTEKVTAMIATGNPPDITWWAEDSLAYFADSGYFYELDDAISSWGDEWDINDFYPSTLEAGQWNGKQYALPFSTPAPVLYYNKGLFDDAGLDYPDESWTWDDFDYAVSQLSKGEGAEKVYGIDNLLDKGKEWQSLLNLIRSYGGDFMNDDLTKCVINSEESARALNLYMNWVNEGYSTKPGTDAPFEQNRVGMFIGWQSFNARFSGVEGLDYDITFVPQGPAGRQLRGGYAGLVVMKTTEFPDESFDLLRFITSQEGVKQQSIYFTPPRKSVGLSEDFMAESVTPVNKSVYIESLEYATVTEHYPDFLKANQIAQDEISKMVAGMQSVEDTLSNIETAINDLLSE